MRAAIYEEFSGEICAKDVPDPTPTESGAVLKVMATGVCRSDWHGWVGHDSDITPPHVPGHEFAGIVAAVGKGVTKWKEGDRVTMPFMGVCGTCLQCMSGNHQVCDNRAQPGILHWGSFAEYIAIKNADANLVALPETMDFETAASLGCRFATSFRALAYRSGIQAGHWVAVHGCGGIGLAAIMIARALGGRVIGIDITGDKLDAARSIGASHVINGAEINDVPAAVHEISMGGANVSIDALGSTVTCQNSVLSLAKRGRHVQIGVMAGDHAMPPVPMGRVAMRELDLVGSCGLQPFRYTDLLAMIESGALHPEKLIGRKVDLEEGARVLMNMDKFQGTGVTVINRF